MWFTTLSYVTWVNFATLDAGHPNVLGKDRNLTHIPTRQLWPVQPVWTERLNASKHCEEVADIQHPVARVEHSDWEHATLSSHRWRSIEAELYLADDGCCLESHTWRSRGSSRSSCSVWKPAWNKCGTRQGQRSEHEVKNSHWSFQYVSHTHTTCIYSEL